MTTQTNAQAALLAAATVYSGSRGNVSVETVAGMASMFKRTLDKADRDDRERWVRDQTAAPKQGVPTPGMIHFGNVQAKP